MAREGNRHTGIVLVGSMSLQCSTRRNVQHSRFSDFTASFTVLSIPRSISSYFTCINVASFIIRVCCMINIKTFSACMRDIEAYAGLLLGSSGCRDHSARNGSGCYNWDYYITIINFSKVCTIYPWFWSGFYTQMWRHRRNNFEIFALQNETDLNSTSFVS